MGSLKCMLQGLGRIEPLYLCVSEETEGYLLYTSIGTFVVGLEAFNDPGANLLSLSAENDGYGFLLRRHCG